MGCTERMTGHREEAAVTALVAAQGDRVYRLAIRLTGNSSDARRREGNATFVLTTWRACRILQSPRPPA